MKNLKVIVMFYDDSSLTYNVLVDAGNIDVMETGGNLWEEDCTAKVHRPEVYDAVGEWIEYNHLPIGDNSKVVLLYDTVNNECYMDEEL